MTRSPLSLGTSLQRFWQVTKRLPKSYPLSHLTESKAGTDVTIQPSGFVQSPCRKTSQVPRGLGAKHTHEGVLEIRPELEEWLTDIKGLSHLFMIWVFERSHVVFTTRSPFRPNALGLTVVELFRREGNRMCEG